MVTYITILAISLLVYFLFFKNKYNFWIFTLLSTTSVFTLVNIIFMSFSYNDMEKLNKTKNYNIISFDEMYVETDNDIFYLTDKDFDIVLNDSNYVEVTKKLIKNPIGKFILVLPVYSTYEKGKINLTKKYYDLYTTNKNIVSNQLLSIFLMFSTNCSRLKKYKNVSKIK